jgi:septal ring factor EnvC (AmiA/AmiB activator)
VRTTVAFVRRTIPLGLVILALGATLVGQTLDRARTEALAQRASERLQALQREADRLVAEEKTLLGELRGFEIKRQLKSEELRQLDIEAAQVEQELADAAARMDWLQQQELAARPALQAQVVEMYKMGQARYLRLLLSTPDVRRIGEASRTVAVLAQINRDRVASYQRMLAELASTRATLDDRRLRMDTLRTTIVVARAAADDAARAHAALVSDIDQRRDVNARLSGELQVAQQKLQLTLGEITPAVEARIPELPLKPFWGDLDWPVVGPVRHRFSPSSGSSRAVASNGVEIAAPEGTPVLAVHDGVVAFADTFAGFGNLVILGHGPQTFTLYGNLLDFAVKKGAHVDSGRPIGTVGTPPTGAAGLYFEMRVDGQPVDPLQWLKKH